MGLAALNMSLYDHICQLNANFVPRHAHAVFSRLIWLVGASCRIDEFVAFHYHTFVRTMAK